jgi:signal transduction histidine kinase/ligand-binding sensor domain-containing protein/DNA-binding response OmpR family regulator
MPVKEWPEKFHGMSVFFTFTAQTMKTMKKALITWIAWLFILSAVSSAGNKLQISFESFPYMSELPSNSVQRVFQDKDGYMWFGTLDGLCRYDAYHVKSFRSSMLNSSLLTNNDISSITEDNQNHLWIGTKQGINILDKSNLKITPFPEKSLQGDKINSLVCDKQGMIWIGTQRGLHRYDPVRKVLKTYAHDPYDKRTVPGTGVTSIYRDRKDQIWVMCWDEGLARYNPKTDDFQRFPRIGQINNPFRLYQDQRNNYWICTWGEGFWHFNPNAPEDQMYRQYPILKNGSKTQETTFYSMVQDDKYGYLWLMSLSGLYVLDYHADGLMENIDISSYLQGSSKLFSEIVKDRDNNLWIGAFSEGAFFINFDRPPVGNYTLDKIRQKLGYSSSVKAICEDKDGTIWMGLNRIGICLFDRNKNEGRMYTEIPGMKNYPELATVSSIRHIKSLDEYWICCNDNLILTFRKTGAAVSASQPVNVNVGHNVNFNGDKVLFEDRAGNVWVGMSGGLLQVTPQKKVRLISEIPSVTDITQDQDGNIWVSSEKTGLVQISLRAGRYRISTFDKYTAGLNTSNIQAVCVDARHQIWIGTKEGQLITYDSRKGRFTDVSNLCAMTGEGILNILEDTYGNIWISTNKKVTKFNPRKKTSTYYSVFDNLAVNSFIVGSCSVAPTGEVLFGGNKGFCAFMPIKENTATKVKNTKVYITDIKVHNQSVFEAESEAVYDNIKGRLVVNHTEKNLEIEFSTLNYSSPSKIQYAYKLEGVDNDWNYVGNSRRFATYNNLQKGTYQLFLRATDENGVWSEEVTTLEIVKKPAFYETWWARLLYLLLMSSFLYGFYRYSLNRFRLRQELKIARIDMEKSEELTQTKLRYFTNISHELLTPLTIISCLIDDLETSFKGKFWQHDVMRVNVSRLKRLLQQILDFRKAESGNMKLKVSEADMVHFLRRICTYNFNPLATEKQIHFSFLSSETSLIGWFDPEKMDTVIFNLLSNAFKYTQNSGSIRVNLDKVVKGSEHWARIIVSDTGRGISTDDIEHIFTRFYSNDPTNTVENHGIGLTLTKEMLEMHHAVIRVDSELGVGTTFTVEVPLDESFYAEKEKAGVVTSVSEEDLSYIEDSNSYPEVEPQDAVATKEDVNVLIVEDNAQLRLFIERIFSKKYNTFTAENGVVALKVMEENPIDIVLSDIVMPEMDGLELCRRIKNNLDTSHIEVLLLTAKNSIDDRIESYNAGADGYLSKPFELKVLDAKIANLVRNRKTKTETFKSNFELNISSMEFASLDEKFLESAVAVIEEHLSEPEFDLDMFSGKLHMSKSSLYRKIKSLTHLSPVEFTKNIRLKHACQMLKNQKGNISDIAYSVGFADPKYFTSCFKAEFGMTPTEFLKKSKDEDAATA